MIIRSATRADFLSFHDRAPPATIRAFAAVDGEDVVAIGGYYYDGDHVIAFTDHKGDQPKRAMIEFARELMPMLRGLGVEVFAESKEHGTTVLRHFGFVPFGDYWRLERR